MIFRIVVDERAQEINVPDEIIATADDYFDMLDRDMDNGYQMSRQWVAKPDLHQRCQIVADRILSAMENNNEKTAMLMAGYILKRIPNAYAMHLTLEGDMTQYELETR